MKIVLVVSMCSELIIGRANAQNRQCGKKDHVFDAEAKFIEFENVVRK